jgi:alpha-L-arabinofuranosidase
MSDHAQARITLHPDFRIGQVDRRVFGSFVEHLGRAVYTGIYEPGHPTADEEGFRRDVAELTRELGVSMVRYPGGNFVSNYVWEDGVGPARDRKPFIDLAWRTIEPNTVGTDEFLQWAEREGIEPMMAVNLGTRGVAAAAALVEYCNGEAGGRWADLRIANGRTEPYGVHLWCLGNEMDGPWQIGHKDAHEYGKLAAESGKAMKLVDPSIALVACGSSSMQMDTFGEWERIVLSHTFDVVDHISMHAYYEELDGDRASFLGSGTAMDLFIRRVVASVDAVAAQRRSDKAITISFDEWNVWYLESRFVGEQNLPLQRDAPRIVEDVYSGLDAVVVGDLLVTLLNHADRVPVACLAQLVNVIAPLVTNESGVLRQSTYYPYSWALRYARGRVLVLRVESDTYQIKGTGLQADFARDADVPFLDLVATLDESAGQAAVLMLNRDLDAARDLVLEWGDVVPTRVLACETLTGPDLKAVNTFADPRRVAPQRLDPPAAGARMTFNLPPRSYTVAHLATRA